MRIAAAVVLFLAGWPLYAQQASEPIALDVIVDEAAQPRAPLSAADFSVTEAGEPLAIQSAQLVQPSLETAPLPAINDDEDEQAAAAVAGRLVGVFLDEYHLEDGAAFAASRAALAAFLRSRLGPRDLVLVVRPLDSLVSLRLTSDREAAARIVEGAEPRQGDYTPRSAFEQDFIAGAPARIDAARNQIALSAVSALAAHLGRFRAGRKTLIVMSNGIALSAPTRGDGVLPGLDSIARSANRARVAIYAARPSAALADAASRAAADPSVAAHDPMEALSRQTTGFVMTGADDIAAGLPRVLRDASRYYLLTVSPSPHASDERFRAVTIALRRQGTVLRARAGYVPTKPETDASRRRAGALPEGLKVPRHVSSLIRAWFGQSAGPGGETTVAFVWEPALRVPGDRGPVVVPSRVSMTVSTLEGATVFAGTSASSGRDAGFASTGAQPQLTFSAAPGPVLVQMDVLDPAGRVLDHDVRDLSILGLHDGLAFGTAAVFRARSEREFRAIADGTGTFAPVASRQFSRTERLVVRMPVTSGGQTPTVNVRLQSRVGGALRDLPTSFSKDVFQVDLPLAPLASGSYTLEFSARSSQGTIIDRIDFVVTP